MELSFPQALILSISLGAIIGLIRQWQDQHATPEAAPHATTAGLRTYALWSLLGFICAHIAVQIHAHFYTTAFATYALFLLAAHVTESRNTPQAFGLTSYATALLTYLCGSLIYWEQPLAALMITTSLLVLTPLKQLTHNWTQRLTPEDIRSALQFAAITGIVLPLVPNEGYGPMQAFNPYSVWLMVVLISGLGFVGYIAMRILGTRAGITLTGIAGGLASSTATTLAFTRQSRDTPTLSTALGMGIVAACIVMLWRVAAIIAVIDRPLFVALIVPFAILCAPSLLYYAWHWHRQRRHTGTQIDTPAIKNPLNLSIAIKFALLYAVIVFLLKATTQWGQANSFYLVSFLSGLTDMDAIALSLANMSAKGELGRTLAVQGILLGALSNTLFKMGFALALGTPALRKTILLGMAPMLLVGTALLFFV